MKWRIWPHRKTSALDARVREAQQRAVEAKAEAERSRRRYEAISEEVVKPLRHVAEENQFSAMLRRSLREGYDGPRPR